MAAKLVRLLIKNNIVPVKYEHIYIYLFEYLIEYSFFIVISILIGSLFNLTVPTIVFLVTFLSMRMIGGGCHAKTHKRCMLYKEHNIM